MIPSAPHSPPSFGAARLGVVGELDARTVGRVQAAELPWLERADGRPGVTAGTVVRRRDTEPTEATVGQVSIRLTVSGEAEDAVPARGSGREVRLFRAAYARDGWVADPRVAPSNLLG